MMTVDLGTLDYSGAREKIYDRIRTDRKFTWWRDDG